MWTIIVLVSLLCLVNYLDRVVISFAIEPIRRDFGVDNTGFGLAMTLFAAGAITINLISGLLLELGITSLGELSEVLVGVDETEINARMDYRYPPGAVRRLDDALLASYAQAYVDLHGNAHRVDLLRARLAKLTG